MSSPNEPMEFAVDWCENQNEGVGSLMQPTASRQRSVYVFDCGRELTAETKETDCPWRRRQPLYN
jgi:hypothetical protein